MELLSFMLTSNIVENRAKGTNLLAECMHCISSGTLNERELITIIQFFCDRLRDHHSIQPLVIYAFLGLTSFHDVSDELIITILQSIFAEVHVQSLVQSDRHNVFNLFSNLLKCRIECLQKYSADFVLGFIQAMDGERDPRSLLICFDNSFMVLEKLDFSLFTEDFFEVLSCYFPVDFTPPKENNFEITKKDLVLSLRKCLTATANFAPFAVPLFIEKLSADMEDAKIDSIITFTKCLEIYNPADVEIFTKEIWLQIRKDYLLSETSEYSSYYLTFVTNFIICLSKSDNEEHLSNLIELLIKDCLQTLKDPDMMIAVQCGAIISRFCDASEYVFDKVANRLLPAIQDSLLKYSSVPQRRNLLEITWKILSVHSEMLPVILVEFAKELLPLLYAILNQYEDNKLHVLALSCIERIVAKKKLLNSLDSDVLAQSVLAIPLSKVLTTELYNAFISLIKICSVKLPRLVRQHFVNPTKKKIDTEGFDLQKQCIMILSKCCINEVLTEEILLLILGVASTSSNKRMAVFEAVSEILQLTVKTFDRNVVYDALLKLLHTSTQHTIEEFSKMSQCLSHAYNKLTVSESKTVLDETCNIVLKHNSIHHNPFEEKQFILLCRSLFTQVDIAMLLNHDVKNVLKEIWFAMVKIESAVFSNFDQFAVEQGSVAIGCVINKLSEDSATPLAKEFLHEIESKLVTYPCPSVILLTWLTKALVLNWQKQSVPSIQLLYECLSKESTGCWAASGFGRIVRDIENSFDLKSGARIKLMYKQRFGQFVLPLLLEGYHNGSTTTKPFYMTAIANTLSAMPKTTIQKYLKSLMPILLTSLSASEENDVTSALTTVKNVLEQNKDTTIEYIDSLISNLSGLVAHQKMSVRMTCLQCLTILSTYPTYIVEPRRVGVIRVVKPALDDKKRFVRKDAVQCINAWYMLAG